MHGTVIKKFVAVLKQKKILGNICFSEQIFYRKQSLGAPVYSNLLVTFLTFIGRHVLLPLTQFLSTDLFIYL